MANHQSIRVTSDDNGVTLSISTTHAETGPLSFDSAMFVATTPCLVKKGANPIATVNSQYLPANIPLGLDGWKPGEQLSFLAVSGTGTVYLTPGS